MVAAADERLRALSKTVFGQEHRLAVMLAIAQATSELVNPGDLAAQLGFRAQSAVQLPIRDLERAGLLTREPRTSRRTFYRRQPSSGWAFAEELAAARDAV
jgi:DNA-binding MarR family transcriptional regulator